MIVLKDIRKNYYLNKSNVISVLKGVNVAFRKNEFVSILGPSGCGKTTLLNIIGGLDVCDSGEIIVGGVSTANFSAADWDNYRNKRIGFVFQSYNLIPHLSVVRNVEMPLILAGVKKSECRQRAIAVLETVGLKEQIYKKPLQLSGGQMQRVALARALVTDPDIILADEPTGALDAESSVQVMDLLRKVANDRLVVMVTHNNSLAEEYSTRIINLSGGMVSGDSNPYVPE
ncbi:MAG: ABC transporter ATP-binding protein, partial [Christensenellales bacterium]